MKGKFLGLWLFLLSFSTWAADDSVLWSNQTFTAPFTDGLIATSAIISNNNEFYDAVKIDVEYEALTPLGCDCSVIAVIEEEITDGLWKPLGYQFEKLGGSLSAPTRIIVVSPDLNFNPGVDNFVAVGEGIRISQTQGNVPERLRVSLYLEDTGTNVLQSITVSAFAKLYN